MQKGDGLLSLLWNDLVLKGAKRQNIGQMGQNVQNQKNNRNTISQAILDIVIDADHQRGSLFANRGHLHDCYRV